MYQHPTTSDHPSPVKTPITGSHVHHMCIISNFYSSYMTFTFTMGLKYQYWYFIFPERHGSQICGLCFNPRALSHSRVPTHVWDQSWHHQVRNPILAETSSSFPSCSLPPDPSPCCGVSHQHLSPVWNVTSFSGTWLWPPAIDCLLISFCFAETFLPERGVKTPWSARMGNSKLISSGTFWHLKRPKQILIKI